MSRRWSALVLAVLAWWGILAAFAAQLLSIGQSELRTATVALIGETQVPVLTRDIVLFVLAQLLIHAAFGIASWLLALASQRAWPRWRVTPIQWTIVWVLLLFAAVDALNTAQFPRSEFSGTVVTTILIGTVSIGDALVALVGALIVVTVALAVASTARSLWAIDGVRRRAQPIAACALTAVAGLVWWRVLAADPQAHVSRERPHVIVIGIDSLRPDLVADERGVSLAPNVRAFLDGATTFSDAMTPLARTFPSWVTILSGKHPVRSGARDNLMPPALFDATPTLGERLRAAGYSTVFATDEVRYSNIDESFGFDLAVTPKIGAADFLIPRWADLPASNLVAGTWLGRVLLPNLYSNRAAATLYRPGTFLRWLDRSVDFERPTFLAVHLTLAHLPYYWADNDAPFEGDRRAHQYFNSVIAVDRQFAALMQRLRERGVLKQAVVVVLSDHGEGLGLPGDSLISSPEAKQAVGPMAVATSGHGNGVLGTTQFQILLAARRFDSAVTHSEPRRTATPASLEDIAPTVLDLLGIAARPGEFDGISLASALDGTNLDPAPASRVRFTESGLTTSAMREGNFSESDNVREAVQFYELDRRTGRVVFNGQRLNDLFAQKERAAVSGEWLLASMPTKAPNARKYILIKRSGGVPEVITMRPEAEHHPVFAQLWQAMKARYGDEVSGGTE